ncbi:MAG: hypothetical protein IPM52_14465 [Bacteroidetes bacterium]|nr:hypothetical protein [Bacteroidota bacterium]
MTVSEAKELLKKYQLKQALTNLEKQKLQAAFNIIKASAFVKPTTPEGV